ncbi:hypothetical protein MKW98_004602 [Papaver atlanticum]|uniref:Uncharacterized protein n=1 Tax=Papaver atlanticum TaxID=357466 RepID=A0AAD4SPJ0_9MAGN|nr:hypothetical protein MKW98_004602 [Papaver atlanticum]
MVSSSGVSKWVMWPPTIRYPHESMMEKFGDDLNDSSSLLFKTLLEALIIKCYLSCCLCGSEKAFCYFRPNH